MKKIEERYNDTERQIYEYQDDNYSIILPKNSFDITNEGVVLQHCVGLYCDAVANNTTTIVFLREKKDIKKPFITMEIRNKIIKQCFGYHDTFNANKDVKEFIENYAKEKGFVIECCIYKKVA